MIYLFLRRLDFILILRLLNHQLLFGLFYQFLILNLFLLKFLFASFLFILWFRFWSLPNFLLLCFHLRHQLQILLLFFIFFEIIKYFPFPLFFLLLFLFNFCLLFHLSEPLLLLFVLFFPVVAIWWLHILKEIPITWFLWFLHGLEEIRGRGHFSHKTVHGFEFVYYLYFWLKFD